MGFEKIREELLRKTRTAVKKRFEEEDVHIVRAVNVLDELDRVFNQVCEQVSEWYGVHFPELFRVVNDNELFLELVCQVGNRSNFLKDKISVAGWNAGIAEAVEKAARNSIGSDIDAAVLSQIQLVSKSALSLRKQRKELEKFVETETKKMMPEFSRLCGSGLLAARLLTKAGSMKRLAIVPSSTIQILGAEKALFRHMKFNSRPPKHGLLFQHSEVQKAERKDKGKTARKIACKLSIAARKDFFGKK